MPAEWRRAFQWIVPHGYFFPTNSTKFSAKSLTMMYESPVTTFSVMPHDRGKFDVSLETKQSG